MHRLHRLNQVLAKEEAAFDEIGAGAYPSINVGAVFFVQRQGYRGGLTSLPLGFEVFAP
jgi:hypothetical protein